MAREVADLLPAAAAMPRTRTVRKDYFSLAEGPINSQLLKNGAPLMSKSYSQIVFCAPLSNTCVRREMLKAVCSQYEHALCIMLHHLQAALCLHGHILSTFTEHSTPSERLPRAAAVAAETRKRHASASSSSSDNGEPLVKRPRGRPRKNPLPLTPAAPMDTSEDMGISPQFLMGGAHLLPAPPLCS